MPRRFQGNVEPAWRAGAGGFIGRRRDLDRLDALFGDGQTQIVTITGAAGIGKTALALRWARDLGDGPVGAGVVVAACDLFESRTAEHVCSAVVAALGLATVQRRRAGDPVVEIGRMLRARGAFVLILDNFEQIVEHARRTIGQWADAAPEARFIVTSRERLRIPGEVVVELAGLSLPDPNDLAAPSEAAELFVARAREIAPDCVTDADRATIGRLVRALDGLPLAIELAADRAPILGPAGLVERLEHRLDALGRGPRGGPSRQSTLRAAIDWSWGLLEPWERVALADCSVFRSGFSLEAAEAVIDLSTVSVLDALQSLRDKSLITRASASDSRFALLSIVREFAAEKLSQTPRAAATRGRHAAYFLAFAEARGSGAYGRPVRAAHATVARDLDNALAAVDHYLDGATESVASAALALRILVSLDVIAGTHGYLAAHVERVGRALSLVEREPAHAELVARALESRGRCASPATGVASREADLTHASELARALGNVEIEARALAGLSRLLVDGGRREAGVRASRAALDIARRSGAPRLEAMAALALGMALHRDPLSASLDHCQRARELYESQGDGEGVAEALTAIALTRIRRGDISGSRRFAELALERIRVTPAPHAEGLALQILGAGEHLEQRPERAICHYEDAIRAAERWGDRRVEATASAYLGLALFDSGDLAAARWQVDDARTELREVGMVGLACLFDAIEATMASDAGEQALAERLVLSAHEEACAAGADDVLVAVDLCRAHVELAAAEAAHGTGDGEREKILRASARARLELAQRVPRAPPGEPPRPPPVVGSLEAIRLASILARRLEGADRREARASAQSLVIAEGGDWFEAPPRARVLLSGSPLLRRLLVALAEARLARPGTALSSAELISSGWAGERMLEESKKNRLKVAVARLRDLGLRGLLASSPAGYLIAPEVRVSFAPRA